MIKILKELDERYPETYEDWAAAHKEQAFPRKGSMGEETYEDKTAAPEEQVSTQEEPITEEIHGEAAARQEEEQPVRQEWWISATLTKAWQFLTDPRSIWSWYGTMG